MKTRPKNVLERRTIEAGELRVEQRADGKPQIRGYAAVFDAMSGPILGFREIVRKGAFKKTLREADVRALWNHDQNFVLGRRSSGTLELSEDEKGLSYTIDPPDTQWANDLMKSMERGDVSQSSFGFITVRDRWNQDGDKLVRELLEVKLIDVSPVTFPAYPQTEVQVRSILDAFGIKSEPLAALLFKAQAGMGLDPEERAAIQAAIDVLAEYAASGPLATRQHPSGDGREPGAAEPHSEEARADVSTLRRKLDLLLV